MRYLLKAVCLLIVSSLLLGGVYEMPKALPKHAVKRLLNDESSQALAKTTGISRSVDYSNKNAYLDISLIDSSLNGYGMYSQTTNPIVYVPGRGVAACYRQWQGATVSSGYIGVAQSSDGINWVPVAAAINSVYPGGTTPDTEGGTPAGRYPNMVGSYYSYPTAIWNELTAATGGGENGGRAMWTWDYLGWLNNVFYSPINDLNTGCSTTPCDPPDLWVGQAQIVDNGTTPVLLSLWGEGLGPSNYYMIRSKAYSGGYFMYNDPVVVFDKTAGFYGTEETNYTGTPEFYINDNGVGYMAACGYWEGYNSGGDIETHTFFYKKTTDFGQTWTSTGGLNNSGLSYISDAVFNQVMEDAGLLGDSLYSVSGDSTSGYDTTWTVLSQAFAGYDYDVKVDADGGLHILTVMMATYPDASGVYAEPHAGLFHLYNATPENDATWTASMIRDHSMSFSADNVGIDGSLSAYQYLTGDMAISADDGSQTLWVVCSGVPDTTWVGSECQLNDIDIYLSVSHDNGATWTDLDNLTNTPTVNDVEYYETTPHLAPLATDTSCFIIWQVADRSHLSVTDNTLYEDYKQWVFVGTYTNSEIGGVVDNQTQPDQFTLSQNYPNPFNPVTKIDYSLNNAGLVKLELFNVKGQKVKTLINTRQNAGAHQYVLDGTGLSSGVYFYAMTIGGITKTNKMILLK